MQTIKTIDGVKTVSRAFRAEGKSIGFIPTMGALHEGHLSLVRRAKGESDRTVVSIFVNPTQFGPAEDFAMYPRDNEGDLGKLAALGTDVVFLPGTEEMYPEGLSVTVTAGGLGSILCGASRPGHFNGVATVVTKLFNIVMPDRAYFGQKDFQQTVVIRRLVSDLNIDTEIVVCPTVREQDGLAMSSRNSYLKKEERKAASVLYRALLHGKDLFLSGITDAHHLVREMRSVIRSERRAIIEYLEIVDAESLRTMEKIQPPAVICLAAVIGKTRLIDNIVL